MSRRFAGLALVWPFSAGLLGEALIFVPLLAIAQLRVGGGIIETAGIYTVGGFLALSILVLASDVDFSLLGITLKWIGLVASGSIVLAVFANMDLGAWFSIGMIMFAGLAILKDTGDIIHDQSMSPIAAAAKLFCSVLLLFWYILRLLISLNRR